MENIIREEIISKLSEIGKARVVDEPGIGLTEYWIFSIPEYCGKILVNILALVDDIGRLGATHCNSKYLNKNNSIKTEKMQ